MGSLPRIHHSVVPALLHVQLLCFQVNLPVPTLVKEMHPATPLGDLDKAPGFSLSQLWPLWLFMESASKCKILLSVILPYK